MNLASERQIRVSRVNVPSPALQIYPETPTEVYEAALNYLPEVQSSEIREQMAEKNIQIAKSCWPTDG